MRFADGTAWRTAILAVATDQTSLIVSLLGFAASLAAAAFATYKTVAAQRIVSNVEKIRTDQQGFALFRDTWWSERDQLRKDLEAERQKNQALQDQVDRLTRKVHELEAKHGRG